MQSSSVNVQQVLQRIRSEFAKRGASSIRGIGIAYREMDNFDGNKKIDAGELFEGLNERGIAVTKAEVDALMNVFDTDHSGGISFDEFLVGLKSGLNATRQAIVDKAFAKFDRDGSGVITAADMRGVYNASRHPKVRSGEMTEEQVFTEFLSRFGDKDGDGKVTKAEWDEYYTEISSSIDNDQHFVEMMQQAWKL